MGLVVFRSIDDLTGSRGRSGNPKLLDDPAWFFCTLSVLCIYYTISWWRYGIDQKRGVSPSVIFAMDRGCIHHITDLDTNRGSRQF